MKLKEWVTKQKELRLNTGKKTGQPILAILLSVAVALVLWFYVQDAESPDYQKTFTGVSVELEGLAGDLAVISGGETEVDITLSGKRADLNRIKVSDLEAYLDLSTVTAAGTYEQEVSVLLPEGTALQDIFPRVTSVFVDATISVSVPVTVELGTYTTAANVGVEAQPALEEVTVKGPRTILEQVDRAEIRTGDLGEIAASFERTLEYELLDANGQPVSLRHLVLPQRNMKVKFAVTLTKTVPLVVKTVHGYWEEDNWRYTVSPETVTVKGEPELMAGVTEITALTVDETQFDTNRLTQQILPSDLALPQGVSLAEIMGDINLAVSVTDTSFKRIRMPLSSAHVVVTPPETEDGTTLAYSFDVDVITLKVRGSSRTVNAATADDFYLYIDLSAFTTPGEREVDVAIVQTNATEGQFYPVGTYVVKVTVTQNS